MCLFTLVCSLCTLVPVQMAKFLTQLHLLDWWKCCDTDSVAEVKHLQQDKGQATLKINHKYYWQFQGFLTDIHRFDSVWRDEETIHAMRQQLDVVLLQHLCGCFSQVQILSIVCAICLWGKD